MIDSFKGEYAFLSNFCNAHVIYEGILYFNSESAFQSAKTLDKNIRSEFIGLDAYVAKKKGKTIRLRPDWQSVRDSIMYDVVLSKFTLNPDLKDKLMSTGYEELVEGNTWRDTYWGVCNGKGQNKLGKILMQVRAELRNA